MSWGDVWVCGAKVRPGIDGAGPQSPWVPAGVISQEERAFVEAMQRLRRTRGGHARAVDFHLHVTSAAVAQERSGKGSDVLGFEPDGLWVAVDVTPAGSDDEARFVVFAQRVYVADRTGRAPEPPPGLARRPLATLSLRGRARSGASALEWAYRAARD